MKPIADRELGLLYARALVAIARADHTIEFEEGSRLAQRITARCTVPLRLEDLLLEPPLTPELFAQQLVDREGPFRSTEILPRELAAALVQDGVAIMLAKGHATETEADRLWRFAEALGLASDEFRRLTEAVAPWFPTTDTPLISVGHGAREDLADSLRSPLRGRALVEHRDPRVSVNSMPAAYATELERLLEHARELLGAGEDTVLADANTAVNHALQLTPECVDAWLLKAQIASATGDDLAALAAVEMALHRAPQRAETLYWHGAVLGDLGRHREAIRSIEDALRVLADADHWLLEDLFYEKVTILDALGLHDAAVTACEAGLDHCPGSPLLRAALAPAERSRVRSSLKVLRGGAL